MGDEKEFRVIDKRGKESEETKKGDSFVMKEKNETPAQPEKIDFATLIFSFATGALINMGIAPDPMTKKKQKNIEAARQNIEILAMLKDKTKGNLSNDESALLENLLTEVRLKFVEASK